MKNKSVVRIKGELEIDRDRGVIYFHSDELQSYGQTPLRIQGLPVPVPVCEMIDLNMRRAHADDSETAAPDEKDVRNVPVP